MKIGMASDDKVIIAQHFGRIQGFVIAEISDGNVHAREYRKNDFSWHMQEGGYQHGKHGHSHISILEALADCDVVLATGIYDDLRSVNIQSIITDKLTVDDALTAYLDGSLVDNPDKGCVP